MTNIKEALRIARGYIADDVTRKPSEYDPRADLRAIDAALAQLDSADERCPIMTEAQIKHMVDRFLMWKLPEHFNPDCGISFDQKYRSQHGPSGTNLFDATQADQMVRHMIDGLLPDASTEPAFPAWGAEDEAYRLGRRDGYESAIQDLDIATGGDGEFKGSTTLGGTVDVSAMKARIVARADASPGNGAEKVSFPATPDDDADFTPDLARKIIARYQQIIAALHSTSAAGETDIVTGAQMDAIESAAIAGKPLTEFPSEAIPADVLAMKEACKRAVYEADYLKDALANIDAIEIDKLSPEVKADASPPDWKQDQAETTRIKPPATAEGGRGEPVAIKPLEWEQPDGPNGTAWLGHGTDMCQYYIRFSTETASYWMPGEQPSSDDDDYAEEFLALDDAKAAAQADYEQRIRSVLVERSSSLLTGAANG